MSSPFAELLAAVAAALDGLGVGWYLFGAQAALVHGAARLTADVDVTVLAGDRETRQIVDALAAAGFTQRVVDDGFVERTCVLPLLHDDTGIPLDLVLGGPGLEEQFLARAERRELDGVLVPVACAEDVVVMKVLAGRPKDQQDVVAVLAARHGALNLELVRETLGLLEQALAQADLLPERERALEKARR